MLAPAGLTPAVSPDCSMTTRGLNEWCNRSLMRSPSTRRSAQIRTSPSALMTTRPPTRISSVTSTSMREGRPISSPIPTMTRLSVPTTDGRRGQWGRSGPRTRIFRYAGSRGKDARVELRSTIGAHWRERVSTVHPAHLRHPAQVGREEVDRLCGGDENMCRPARGGPADPIGAA